MTIKVVKYDNPKDCVKRLFNFSNCNSFGFYVGYDNMGQQWKTSPEEMVELAKKMGCWGFVVDRSEIHLWHKNNVDIFKMITFLSHELSHTIKPYHPQQKEEIKAGNYATICKDAIVLTHKIIDSPVKSIIKINRPKILLIEN